MLASEYWVAQKLNRQVILNYNFVTYRGFLIIFRQHTLSSELTIKWWFCRSSNTSLHYRVKY